MRQRIVVVGASLAGLRAAETLRDRGFDGELTLIGEEPHLPYDRPPLSKQVLQGTWEPDQTFFRKKEGYDALALDMRLGVRAMSVDPRAKRVTLAGGTFADYDRLIIATGARVRTLPGIAPRSGLLVLRGLDDAIALRRELMHATHVAIVGAGFIGLEVAASCRARGLHVTVIESLPLPLAPILGPALCEMIAAMHRDHGVDLRTGVAVTDVFGPESRVAGVALSDGSRIAADVVVVGIGVTPNTEWLEGSGLTLDNGIVCNGSGEAAPDVYAAGDVARVANRWHGDSPRIEHWTNAVEQAVHAAENALAVCAGCLLLCSYFWSTRTTARPTGPRRQEQGRLRIAISTPLFFVSSKTRARRLRIRFFGLAILHQLQRLHHAEAARVADELVLFLQRLEPLAEIRADDLAVLHEVLFFDHLDRRHRRRHAHGVSAERRERDAREFVGDLRRRDRHRDRGAVAHAFGADHDVRRDVPVLDSPPVLAGAAPCRLHFVGDEQPAVLPGDRRRLSRSIRAAGR